MNEHLKVLDTLNVPADLEEAVHKLELFLVRSRPRASMQYWNALQKRLQKEGQRDRDFFEDTYYRLTKLALHRTQLQLASLILSEVTRERYQDETYQDLKNLLGHFQDAENHISVFPYRVPYEDRFEGPHLFSFENGDGEPVYRWLAGKVRHVDDEGVHTTVVDPLIEGGPAYGRLSVPSDSFQTWGGSVEDVKEGDFFEIVTYGNEDAVPQIKFWDRRKWAGWARLLPHIDPLRYVRASGLVEGGQTFMELILRGEAELEDIDEHVEDWHESDEDWPLSDHLGMLPEEYQRWQGDPSSLVEIIEERQQRLE